MIWDVLYSNVFLVGTSTTSDKGARVCSSWHDCETNDALFTGFNEEPMPTVFHFIVLQGKKIHHHHSSIEVGCSKNFLKCFNHVAPTAPSTTLQ